MSKSAKKAADQAEREKVHKRYSNRREPDVIYPAKKQVDFYDADIHQRVAVYVRVSTDNLGQETSYELQKNYYEEFVLKHPNWKLVKIYADKGISGTSTKHRVELNQMLADSRAGKIDLIITKSVSRLARNTVDCITMVYDQPAEGDATFEVAAGDFDLRGFEVTNASLFDANKRPYVLFQSKQIKFSTDCVRQFGKDNKVELLTHPGLRKLAVRRASKDSRQCVQWSRPDDGKYYAKEIPCTAFGGTLFELLDWETDFKFRAYGRLLQNEGDPVFIFDLSEPEVFIQSYLMTGTDSPISGDGELSPLSVSGKRVRAVPKKLADRFGSDFYSHRLTSSSPELQSEDAWKLWLEGQLFETGEKLRVTQFDEMQRFIAEQLAPIKQMEEVDFNA